MGVRYIAVSAASTVLSFVFLQFWTELSLDNLKSDGLIAESNIHSENASRVIELLSGSYATIGLLTNFVLNVFVLLVLCLQIIFLWSCILLRLGNCWNVLSILLFIRRVLGHESSRSRAVSTCKDSICRCSPCSRVCGIYWW
nr:E3 ubiquitin protein ligase RIN2-like [Quercus suber]XP_023888809.1 E3 ubiquitin protein ligase RIN2-like [Quercus suber]